MTRHEPASSQPTLDASRSRPSPTANSRQTAAENIRAWLTEPRYAEYADEVAAHIAAGKWQALDDVFWTVIPFGTGGRRGQDVPDRLQRHQRPHDRRERPGAGRLREGHARQRRAAVVRDRLRHAASVGALRPAVRRDHDGRRLHGLLPARAIAARRSCRSPCATRSARAASWSRPATIRRATTR